MYGITENANEPANIWFDYTNQAWVVNGRYERCGHRDECDCYGRQHEGELAPPESKLN